MGGSWPPKRCRWVCLTWLHSAATTSFTGQQGFPSTNAWCKRISPLLPFLVVDCQRDEVHLHSVLKNLCWADLMPSCKAFDIWIVGSSICLICGVCILLLVGGRRTQWWWVHSLLRGIYGLWSMLLGRCDWGLLLGLPVVFGWWGPLFCMSHFGVLGQHGSWLCQVFIAGWCIQPAQLSWQWPQRLSGH